MWRDLKQKFTDINTAFFRPYNLQDELQYVTIFLSGWNVHWWQKTVNGSSTKYGTYFVCVCMFGQNIQSDHVVVVNFLIRNEININGISLYEWMGTWPQRNESIWRLMSQLLAAGVFMFHYQSSHDTKLHVVVKMYQMCDFGLDYICSIFLHHHISNPHIFHSMPYALSSWHTILNALPKYKGASTMTTTYEQKCVLWIQICGFTPTNSIQNNDNIGHGKGQHTKM